MISVHGCPMVTPGMRSAGGMNVYLREIAPLIASQGVCVDVFTRSHHEAGPEVLDIGPRARVIHLPAGDPELVKAQVVPHLPEYTERLNDFVEREGLGYDLVHSHYWLSGVVGQRLAARLRVPHVVSFHTLAAVKEREGNETEPLGRKLTEERMSSRANLVFAFTEDESRELEGLFGIDPRRIHVAPGGVDLTLFTPRDQAEARRRLGMDRNENIILFVGRPEPFKGPDVLVRALAAMPDRSDVRLVLLGGSEEEHSFDWLREAAAAAGVSDRLRWQSALPQSELPDYYAAADVCAVPSFHESFGFAALESMACGTPVVAASVGALQTLIVDGETGCLVPTHQPEDFAHCIESLLDNPRLRERMGASGVERARSFTWAHAADLAMEGYRGLLARAATRADVIPCLQPS
jgi:D-inositol-3-phosphate glycosyltransferase